MPLLVLLLIVVPIAELWAIIQVGQLVGLPATIGLLLADSLLGAWLLRSQGRMAWRRVRESLAAGRLPASETADGALVILGGALLLTPGFITDVLGFMLLFPPTRALVRRLVLRRAVTVGARTAGGPAAWTVQGVRWSARGAHTRRGGRQRRRPVREHDVEGTAVEADRRELGGSAS